MNSYVLGFQDIDRTKLVLVGGKGANLGELSRIEGIQVPEVFALPPWRIKNLSVITRNIKSCWISCPC